MQLFSSLELFPLMALEQLCFMAIFMNSVPLRTLSLFCTTRLLHALFTSFYAHFLFLQCIRLHRFHEAKCRFVFCVRNNSDCCIVERLMLENSVVQNDARLSATWCPSEERQHTSLPDGWSAGRLRDFLLAFSWTCILHGAFITR